MSGPAADGVGVLYVLLADWRDRRDTLAKQGVEPDALDDAIDDGG